MCCYTSLRWFFCLPSANISHGFSPFAVGDGMAGFPFGARLFDFTSLVQTAGECLRFFGEISPVDLGVLFQHLLKGLLVGCVGRRDNLGDVFLADFVANHFSDAQRQRQTDAGLALLEIARSSHYSLLFWDRLTVVLMPHFGLLIM